MAFRAVWHQWTWTGACQTSSTMPSIGVDRLSVAVKVPPFFFLSYSLVASTKPLCCLCQCPLPPFSSPLSFPLAIPRCIHLWCPPVTAEYVKDMCHRLQEHRLADVFPVSHTCRVRTISGIDIRLLLIGAFASSMAERASGTFISVLHTWGGTSKRLLDGCHH